MYILNIYVKGQVRLFELLINCPIKQNGDFWIWVEVYFQENKNPWLVLRSFMKSDQKPRRDTTVYFEGQAQKLFKYISTFTCFYSSNYKF